MKATIVMLILFFACLSLVLLVFFNSGNPKPYTCSNCNIIQGSISEKLYLDVNSSKQGVCIKGKNINNPVLLYLHGGMPDYFLTQKYPTGLDDIFTVVWWEQRGAGISFNKNTSNQKITINQLVDDTKCVSEYLIKRFGKEKIYLMGRSGGTIVGIHAAAEAPELFYAYIAVGQITKQLQSEKMAHNFMLQQYEQNGNKPMVKKLRAAQITGDTLPYSYLKIRDKAMHQLGVGTMRNMKSIVTGLFFQSLMFKEYTVAEKWKLWQAKANAGVSVIWDEVIKTDIPKKICELEIPVYFLHGEHDYTVSYPLAKAYFDKIKAPKKQFFSFSESAHSPIFEEPEKCKRILKKICTFEQTLRNERGAKFKLQKNDIITTR